MRRADRLFQIIQVLRGTARPVTASQLAEEFETTARTIYRDIADLIAQRVPIRGEAGVGYVLERGYDMPPLMLTPNEIEAAVLGAQWVAARGDPGLARGARDLVAKIRDVVPEHLRPVILQAAVVAPSMAQVERDQLDLERIRRCIHNSDKLRIRYRDLGDHMSERVIWPISVAYLQTVRLLVAWCELRNAFRHFRTDRIETVESWLSATRRLRKRCAWPGDNRSAPRARLILPTRPRPMGATSQRALRVLGAGSIYRAAKRRAITCRGRKASAACALQARYRPRRSAPRI